MTLGAKLLNALEGVGIALDAIRANKTRAALTIFGVAIGVFVVVAMSSVIRGVNESFARDLEAAGPTSFYIYRRPIGGFTACDGSDETCPERRNPGLTIAEKELIEQLPTIRSVTAHIGSGVSWRYKDKYIRSAGLEVQGAVQDVPEFGIGSGLTDLELGARLRYEIRRELAPYVGLAWHRLLGETADLARGADEEVSTLSLVVGLRAWY